MFIQINFGLWNCKKDNTWFILKFCLCAKKDDEEALQAQYSFSKLGGYKGLYCTKYCKTQI